jgi:hypothetical protein
MSSIICFGLLDHRLIGVVDGDGARIFDVDLDLTALGDDVIDDFAAGADDIADLIRIDVEGNHLRRVLADLFAGFRDGFLHDFADLGAGLVGLLKGFGRGLRGSHHGF